MFFLFAILSQNHTEYQAADKFLNIFSSVCQTGTSVAFFLVKKVQCQLRSTPWTPVMNTTRKSAKILYFYSIYLFVSYV